MLFRWNAWNIEHVEAHGVSHEEAESVVRLAAPPYPLHREDDKWLVWGPSGPWRGGRLLQVVFVIDDEDKSVFVIQARLLTDREKRSFRRRIRK